MKFKISEARVLSELKGNSRFFCSEVNYSSFYFVYLIGILL